MASPRYELKIDVFEMKEQRGLVMPSITGEELVEAVLQEFRELEYLSRDASQYRLMNGDRAIDPGTKIEAQVNRGDRLTLIEPGGDLPAGTRAPSVPAYLRENATDRVYRIGWAPGVIGRFDARQADNDQLTVDLQDHVTGLRVSRRHARITEKNGIFMIESLSNNPTWIKHVDGRESQVSLGESFPLQNGDIIYLERSNISLKFITRAVA